MSPPLDPTLALVQATLGDLRKLEACRRELTAEVARTARLDPLRRQMFRDMLDQTGAVARRLTTRLTGLPKEET